MAQKTYSKKTYKKPYVSNSLKNEIRKEVIKELKSKADLKYTDRSALLGSVSSTGAVYNLTANLTRGDEGINNFSGNSIKPKGLTISYGVTTTQSYNFCRVMVIQWNDSGTPALTGIFSDTTIGMAPFSNIYVTNRKNIKVLYDKAFTIAPTANNGGTILGEGHFTDKFYIDGKRIKEITYQSNADTVQDSNLFLVAVSDDSVVSYPTITFFSRISFYDDM